MKKTELMVGDWVYDKHFNGDIEPIQIHNIYGTEVNCKTARNHFDVDEIVSGTYMSNLQPIPLTPEILEENGFKKGKTQYYQDFYEFWSEDLDRCIYLYVYEEYFLLFDNSNADIKYVHELQHALRLCGIDKEIEI